MAKRQGRKSAAQTPAPPKERIFGSKKNPKGSASSEKTASKIQLSDQIIKTLEKKLKEFKEKYPSKKNVTLPDLKAVYRRGAGAYSKSHRPTITGGAPNSRNAWSMARVNKFLLKAGGAKVKAAYVQDDDLLKMESGGELQKKKIGHDKYILKTPYRNARKHYELIAKILSQKGVLLLKSPSPHTGSYYIEAGNDKYSVWVRISNHLKPNDDNYEVIKSSGDSRHNWVEINILSTKDFDEAIKYLDVIFLSNPDIRYAKGGEIEFEYLREAEDEEVENFFDSNWQEISRWSEGEGRGTTPHAIYTNGSQDLLEREDYGFDGYNSPQYFFVSINDSFAKGGEINELSGKITRYEDGSAWVDLYDKKGNAVGDLDISYDTIENLLYSPYESQISKKEYYSNPQYKNLINQLKIYGLKPTDKVHYLEEIYIDDNHRGKGYASAAVNQLISFYKSKGDKYLLLTVGDYQQKNGLTPKQIIEFYSRHGFKLLKGTGNYQRRMIIDLQNKFAKGGEIDPKVLRERWAKKKDALQNLAINIQRLRTNLSKDLKEGDEKERLTALVVKVMDETGERVGNDVSADNGHFGVTGLKKKHIKVNGSNLKFKYTGKSGVEHEKQINDSTLANAMREAINNSPSEYVFETSDGFRIKNDRVNRYLNRFDVSAKDLRGYSANKWIITRLKSVKDREILGDAKKRKTKFNEIVKDVAEKVGHGRATLKKHYLLPSLEREFINHGKIVDLSNIKRTYEDGGEIDSNSSAKRGKLLDKYAFADKYMGNVSKVARKIQSTKDFENANELEFKLYRLLDDWAENTNDRNANQLYRKKEIIEKLKKQYPKIFQVPKNTIVYRGLGFYSDDSKNYGGKNLNYYLQLFLKDFNFDDVVKIKGNNWENFYFIKRPISYIEKRNVQSWTTDWKTAVSFGEEGIIMVKKTNDEFFMNPELLNSISRSDENEVLHFGKQIEDAYILISDTALEKISNKFDELGIKKSKRINEVSKQFARGGDTNDEINTGFDALANLETEPLNELADVPNDGLGIYDKGGKTDDVKIVESKRNRNVRFTISGKAVALVEKTPLMDALDYVPYSLGDKDKETRRMYGYAKKEQYLKKQGLKDFNEEFWYLNFIEVKPKYRGQGLASILMKSILKWAKENNIKYLYLYSMPLGEDDGLNEKKLKRFYEKFGFKEIASDTMVKLFARGGANDDLIALPDTYAHYERLKEILRNQGYDLTKKGMARGGDTHDEVNTGFDALANLETEPLNELADVPNDGQGIYDKGGKTQYSDGVSKLVNKESIEHLIPTFDEDDINWFKLVHSKDLINQLLENIGIPIKVKYELGEGSYGTAWMTENDTVLKLTKNGAEAYSSYIIFKNQENFRSQAEIYNIFIINDYSKVDVQRIYFIEKQYLNPFQDSKASSISHIYNDIEATATATKYSNNDRLEMLENIIRDENLSDQQSIYARQVFALAKDVDKEARAYGINLGDNHTGNVGFDNSGKLLCYDCAHVGNKKLNKGGNLKNENMENLKVGGEISQEEKKEIYAKWKKLVNMSKSELQKFYDSEEGKQAGLTPEEAKAEGIDSGRESARWVMKMKDTKVADWTPTMWMWAKKQISFVSRMSGNKGKLVDENGKKTRKYLSLLIWGNDPNKKAGGGDIDEPCHVCSMNDAQYQNLPALGEMADGKRFVYRESVFAKGGDTMSHVGDRYLILECMGEGGITDTLNLKVIQSSSPALLVGSVINRPIRNIINKGREMGTTFGQNIVGSYKKGGELNPDNKSVKNYFEHKSGSAGGLLVGKRHSEGGIKAINNSTGQPLEMEGGEVVITRDAVSDPTPVEFEGKKMTKREVLSEINQSGGGVAFADGGVVGEKTA